MTSFLAGLAVIPNAIIALWAITLLAPNSAITARVRTAADRTRDLIAAAFGYAEADAPPREEA